MPPKVARTSGSSKTQPPKTMAKASSSSKSSGSSKTSSSSSVKKSTPPPAKPKNVDKVEFNKPKPTKVTYEPSYVRHTKADPQLDKLFPARAEMNRQIRNMCSIVPDPADQKLTITQGGGKSKAKPADDPSNQDYDPMIMQPSQRQAAREIIHEEAVKASENKAAQHAVRATATEAAGRVGGAPARIAVGAASFTETGEKIVKKTVEIIDEALGILGENYTFEDMP